MQVLAAKHSTRYFTFIDETLTSGIMRRLSDELIAAGFCGTDAYYWYGETRFSPQFDNLLASKLAHAGCRKLQFGLESYNQRVLDLMKKGVKVAHIRPNVEALLGKGIAIHMFFMVGFPTETEEEARNTDRFTREVVKLSREKYGNPFTTRGFDVFNLDPLAPAFHDPEHHQIDIVPQEEDSLYFDVNYRARIGLQQEDSRKLAAEFRSGIVPLLRSAPRLPPSAALVEDSEEINFLGACWLSEGAIPPDACRPIDQTVFSPRCGHLAEGVISFDIPGLLERQEPAPERDSITLYAPRTSMWVELDKQIYRALLNHSQLDGVPALKLKRWGFIDRGDVDDRLPVPFEKCYPVFFADECHCVQTNRIGNVSMLLHASGRVVKVSPLIYLALRYSDGQNTLTKVFDKLSSCVRERAPISLKAVASELCELSEHGFLAFSDLPCDSQPLLHERIVTWTPKLGNPLTPISKSK
jgi:hypothetical protein